MVGVIQPLQQGEYTNGYNKSRGISVKFIKNIFKKKEKPKQEGKKFSSKVRVNGDKMTDKEKMDKGFDGKTYSLNGIDYDF